MILSLVLVVGVGGCVGSDDENDPECGNLLLEAGEMCSDCSGTSAPGCHYSC